jgi:hypothetical protein
MNFTPYRGILVRKYLIVDKGVCNTRNNGRIGYIEKLCLLGDPI